MHATNAPLTIYGIRTHGCIRLHPDDARELFDQGKPGQAGEVIYEPMLLARVDDGRIFLEVHPDTMAWPSTAPISFICLRISTV